MTQLCRFTSVWIRLYISPIFDMRDDNRTRASRLHDDGKMHLFESVSIGIDVYLRLHVLRTYLRWLA